MTNTWQSGVSGDWNTAADWSADMALVGGTSATIAASGTYRVTISSPVAVRTLTLDAPGASPLDGFALALGGVLSLEAGIIDLYGTIAGGKIVDSGSDILAQGGVLSGVIYEGTSLNLTGSQTLSLSNGTVVENATGTDRGIISLAGHINYLYFDGPAIFYNGTIEFTGYYDEIAAASTATWTFGPNPVINVTGSGILDAHGHLVNIVNEGTVSVSASAGYLGIDEPMTFTNTGSIIVSNGGMVGINGISFADSASGTISVTGSGLQLYLDSFTLTNDGAISIGSGGALHLGGSLTDAFLSGVTVASGGIVSIDYGATLNNTGQTLDIGTALPEATLVQSGTIVGGTIIDTSSSLVLIGGMLSGVTYEGTSLK